jgi:4'-phosphopantetheinyl transferase
MASPFSLWQLPGIQPEPAWPPAGAVAGRLGSIPAGPVQVLALALPADPEPWLAALRPWASELRLQRAARLPSPGAALRCLAAEALLRHALRASHGLELDTQVVRVNRYGKPRLAALPHVHFNLSHSGAWLVCALHDRPVGIDIEATRARLDLPADLILHPAEQVEQRGLEPAAARDHFFRLWTLKESLLKALGTGLGLDPRSILVAGAGPGYRAILAGRGLATWPLLELPGPEGLRVALCHATGKS